MIGEPIAGCLGERDPVGGFRATLEAARYRACASRAITLANRLVLEDRLPVEFGKPDGQRDQFAAEVKPAVALFPLLLIVNRFCLFLRPPPGVAASISWAQFFGNIHLPLLIAIRVSFLEAPPGDVVGGGCESRGHTIVKFGLADAVEQHTKSNQREYFVVE